jgi:hypothetical protein
MYLIERFEAYLMGVKPDDNTRDDEQRAYLPLLYAPRVDSREYHQFYRGLLARFVADIRLRHPFAYLMFYRWWIQRRIRKSFAVSLAGDKNIQAEKAIKQEMTLPHCHERECQQLYDVRFALYNPWLFIFWLMVRACGVFLEKLLTAPIKKVCWRRGLC